MSILDELGYENIRNIFQNLEAIVTSPADEDEEVGFGFDNPPQIQEIEQLFANKTEQQLRQAIDDSAQILARQMAAVDTAIAYGDESESFASIIQPLIEMNTNNQLGDNLVEIRATATRFLSTALLLGALVYEDYYSPLRDVINVGGETLTIDYCMAHQARELALALPVTLINTVNITEVHTDEEDAVNAIFAETGITINMSAAYEEEDNEAELVATTPTVAAQEEGGSVIGNESPISVSSTISIHSAIFTPVNLAANVPPAFVTEEEAAEDEEENPGHSFN